MEDSDVVSREVVLPAQVETDLAVLRQVLELRGWDQDPDDPWCWRWSTSAPAGLDLFRAGPLILFDEEDPDLGYLVESPLLYDQAAPILQYRSVETLINNLDRIETWTYPQRAAEIDPHHTVLPGDISSVPRQHFEPRGDHRLF
jgi:hypothetical protein